ncbi:MAG: helix-turn-helix transcriptional regulator [Lachnospiraceae bacterium]|nr:helix-turn-helix transcriptional regulator [Lachnospiraceae bacterium]
MKELKEETLGQRIKAQRIRIGMTQDDLADRLCIPKATISAYENDKIDIKASRIIEISKVLLTTPNYLLGYEGYYKEGNEKLLDDIKVLIGKFEDERIKELFFSQIMATIKVFNN